MKIGIVGLGKMGLLHASILSYLPDVQIPVVCEGNDKLVRFIRPMFKHTQFVNDITKLGGSKLDGMFVTTPIPSHFPITKYIYENGISNNIFTEKTLAANMQEAAELSALADKSKGVNMVGYMNRFAVTFVKGKQLLAEGCIGNPVSFQAHALSSDFVSVKKGSPKRGGALRDLGSHIIDMAIWYLPDQQIVTIDENTPDTTKFSVNCAGGLKGAYDVSWCRPGYRYPEFQLTVNGEKGAITIDGSSVKLIHNGEKPVVWYRQDLNDNVPFLLGSPEYYREDAHFIESILTSKTAAPSFLAAAKTDALIGEITSRNTTNE